MKRNIYQCELKTGLKCVFYNTGEKGLENKVSLFLSLKCGSMKSNVDQKETAHLLEHIIMSFDHEKRLKKHYFFTKACTNFLSTTFQISCNSEDTEFCLKILLSVFSIDSITEKNRIRAVKEIQEESASRYKDKKSSLNKNILMFKNTMFGEFLPNVKIDNLAEIKIDDLKKYHKDWYVHDNSQLIIAFNSNTLIEYNEMVNNLFVTGKSGKRKSLNSYYKKYDICNNETYVENKLYSKEKMLTFLEIKQQNNFVAEKVEKELFFQGTIKLLYDFFKKRNVKICDFTVNQFEDHSFIFLFEFNEVCDSKKILNDFFDYLYNNVETIIDRIKKVHINELILPLSSYEILSYISKTFIYEQDCIFDSTTDLVKQLTDIMNRFENASIISIIEDLKKAKYKSFIFENGRKQ